MDLPATEPAVTDPAVTDPAVTGPAGPEPEWLIDADDPLLTPDKLERIADPSLPDRLMWNTFRTLALWDADVWVPRLFSIACGPDNVVSALDWGGASVVPWAVGPFGQDVSDVVIDGPEGYAVVACTVQSDAIDQHVGAGALAALDGSLHGARQAGFVVVVPPGTPDMADRLDMATEIELMDGRLATDLLEGAMGSISWTDLGRLVLDLAEEADPDSEPAESVHRLVTELQALYPDVPI